MRLSQAYVGSTHTHMHTHTIKNSWCYIFEGPWFNPFYNSLYRRSTGILLMDTLSLSPPAPGRVQSLRVLCQHRAAPTWSPPPSRRTRPSPRRAGNGAHTHAHAHAHAHAHTHMGPQSENRHSLTRGLEPCTRGRLDVFSSVVGGSGSPTPRRRASVFFFLFCVVSSTSPNFAFLSRSSGKALA